MVKDAEAHASEDEAAKEKIDLRNQADQAVFQTEKFLKENGDKIDDAKKSEVEATIEPVKEALKADDDEQIKSTMEKMNEAMQAAATEMYAKAQQEADAQQQAEPGAEGAEAPAGEKQADGDVVDADYTMEDEK